jgi:hypothetical protein
MPNFLDGFNILAFIMESQFVFHKVGTDFF